ncbi:hypothetical protein ACFQI7_36785 [Paenibacillus allorhizosphaerae]|uniref:Uncharacterized protein n=1 Tax=Paenibacillus allorhizosphaerae TaxID=2849866 RepID=A0ABM8VUT1_9BACL|nr:hypothetical protein [Paenibacillus allorhizosphaerae]CAG7658997.1 hypothetical protein PAECIP111802_07252 [Paenibacillus allorhizosphaerae]
MNAEYTANATNENAQYGYSLDEYLDYMMFRQKAKHERKVQKAKERGEEYYIPDRVRKMQYAQRLATY